MSPTEYLGHVNNEPRVSAVGDVLLHSDSQRGKIKDQRTVELPLISSREEYNHSGDLQAMS